MNWQYIHIFNVHVHHFVYFRRQMDHDQSWFFNMKCHQNRYHKSWSFMIIKMAILWRAPFYPVYDHELLWLFLIKISRSVSTLHDHHEDCHFLTDSSYPPPLDTCMEKWPRWCRVNPTTTYEWEQVMPMGRVMYCGCQPHSGLSQLTPIS